uniref:Uncharacterized protein n=1 Tax=Porodaedalea pini TaxID=108901 RepID=A0A5B9RCI8_9AGAM|nr:hypothetical protein PPIT_000123 [Porodaedalea pini]QEG57019.1 hypothetical protein PPIT_000123 [Porodaedalea pini]
MDILFKGCFLISLLCSLNLSLSKLMYVVISDLLLTSKVILLFKTKTGELEESEVNLVERLINCELSLYLRKNLNILFLSTVLVNFDFKFIVFIFILFCYSLYFLLLQFSWVF